MYRGQEFIVVEDAVTCDVDMYSVKDLGDLGLFGGMVGENV